MPLPLAFIALGLRAILATTACDICEYQSFACSSDGSVVHNQSVCNAAGHVQMDDVFCDDTCNCADGYAQDSPPLHLRDRFDACRHVSPTAPPTSTYNLTDWALFRSSACVSEDCLAARALRAAKLHMCGRLVVLWKELPSTYHFITEGTLRNTAAGNFHVRATWDAALGSLNRSSLVATPIAKCYTLQTRNTNNAKCRGHFLVPHAVLASATSSAAVDLSVGVWAAVVSSVVAAVLSIVSVMYLGFHSSRGRALERLQGAGDSHS
ncbi:hypothetical protein ACHHYP_04377 [Achlya hypogyna]|uniref:Secreted protein n=1 Tax=Achlya hypogyna TaxID=1202772 RepID=A0A1V9Z1H2_ACHHY|nr:hypothetical protein ACHHYP_04377 [Achlya hypogyna]